MHKTACVSSDQQHEDRHRLGLVVRCGNLALSLKKACLFVRFDLAVALPAVLVGFGGRTSWRCKLLVSGGVTRGRVAHGAMGSTSPKHMAPRAQAQKQPKAGPKTGTATGREASLHLGGLTSQQQRNGWPRGEENKIAARS